MSYSVSINLGRRKPPATFALHDPERTMTMGAEEELWRMQRAMPRFVVADMFGGEVAIVYAASWPSARSVADMFAAAKGVPPETLRVHPARKLRPDTARLAEMGAA